MGLAGRRIKQRIGKDPRNLAWADDAAKFGANYLAKFGWDASKGLGVEGEGRTSHIKVSQKLDMLGIGAAHQKDPNGIAWKQNKDFENLLKRLNEQQGGEGDGNGNGGEVEKEVLGGGWVRAKGADGMKEGGEEPKDESDGGAEKGHKKRKKRKAEEQPGGKDEEDKSKKKKKKQKETDMEDAKSEGKAEQKDKKKKSKGESEDITSKKRKREEETDASLLSEDGHTSKPPAEPVQEPTPSTTPVVPRHRAHRARAIAAKRMAATSAAAISEILGIAPTPSLTTPQISESQTPQGTLTPISDNITIENLTTSTKSVADYFKEKLMAKAQSGSGSSTPMDVGSDGAGPSRAGIGSVSKEGDEEHDVPRVGLGGSRLRLSSLTQTHEQDDSAQRIGLSKFSSLMSSTFLKATSTLPSKDDVQASDESNDSTVGEGLGKQQEAAKKEKGRKGKKGKMKEVASGEEDSKPEKKKKKKALEETVGGAGVDAGVGAEANAVEPDPEAQQKDKKDKKKRKEKAEKKAKKKAQANEV